MAIVSFCLYYYSVQFFLTALMILKKKYCFMACRQVLINWFRACGRDEHACRFSRSWGEGMMRGALVRGSSEAEVCRQ